MNKVFIRRIDIDHVRHLSDISIPVAIKGDFRHLVLTGKSGSGKTSVLNSIADFLASMGNGVCPSELEKDVAECSVRLDHWRQDPEMNKASIHEGMDNLEHYKKKLKNARRGIDLFFNMEDIDVRKEFEAGNCVFAFFGAQRKFDAVVPTQIQKVIFDECYAIYDSPRRLFIQYLLDLKMTQALAVSGGNQDRADEIQQWFDRVREILCEIYEDPTLALGFDEDTFRFSIQMQGREPFDFNEASDGFSAVIDIVVDLMLRMVKRNGRATDFDMPGIALVEVENHLHLSLQRRVLPMLVKLFPNVQFIVTTHSPFVLSSLDNALVYDLDNNTLAENCLSENTYESIVEGSYNVGGGDGVTPGKPGEQLQLPLTFTMSAKLDNTRVNRDVRTIMEEIVSQLIQLEGADVELSFEVRAQVDGGIPVPASRAISENCNTLHIKNFRFDG